MGRKISMISVVLPAFNESETLENTTKDIFAYLKSRKEVFEIIIVENGSSDNTRDIGKRLSDEIKNVKFFSEVLPDYGAALRRGLREACGDIIVNFDVDFYDFDFLERSVQIIREHSDHRPAIVVGSKRTEGANDNRPVLRRFATFIFSSILKFGFGLGVSDTHGIKAMHRSSVIDVERLCKFTVYLFDTELILRCERSGIIVSEIPVSVEESRPARSNLISRIPRTLFGLAKMRFVFFFESIFRRGELKPAKLKLMKFVAGLYVENINFSTADGPSPLLDIKKKK